jgi:hypothetical protein
MLSFFMNLIGAAAERIVISLNLFVPINVSGGAL